MPDIFNPLQFHDNVETGFPPDCPHVKVTLVPLLYLNPSGRAVKVTAADGESIKDIYLYIYCIFEAEK